MGKLTRRVKFIAKERRLSIPAEFLHQHGIERGDTLVVSALKERLYVFPLSSWERLHGMSEEADRLFPDEDHPFLAVIRGGTRLRLGSQDRIVLPRTFPFRLDQTTRLFWEIVDGLLRMEPEHRTLPERPALTNPAGQRSLLDLVGANTRPELRFERESAERRHIEAISVSRIDWRDRTFAEADSLSPGEALLRSVKVEGVRRPLVLRARGDGGFQVIDGFRRLAAARQLRMRSVPALVWRELADEDAERLKLMEPARPPGAEGSTLHRLQSTLRLHNDQVALKEIEHITGRRKRTLQRYLRVAQEPRVREAVESGRLSIFKAEEILKSGIDPDQAIREGWTVRRIREAGRKAPRKRTRRRHGERE